MTWRNALAVEFSPKRIAFSDLIEKPTEFDVQLQIRDVSDHSSPIDSFAYFRRDAKNLICLFPSAQPSAGPQQNPIFHRWSWYNHFPESHVISLSDPGLYSSSEIRAAWFMGQGNDIVVEMAQHISRIAYKLDIALDDIVLYGSSMGGFGALMVAAELRHSTAVAEVPQLDMRLYPIPGAIRDIEDKVIKTKLGDYYRDYPERVSVLDRFQLKYVIPKFRIVTNRADAGYPELLEFMSKLGSKTDTAFLTSDCEMLVLAEEIGHKPLSTARGIEIVRAALATPLRAQVQRQVDEPKPERTYRQLVDSAVAAISQIKFIRSDPEKVLYETAKSELYAAAALDPSADWPYRRLCSLIKLWTNSFNSELLASAEMGLARKETLESFVYVCRGLLYNHSSEVAEGLVKKVLDNVSDPDIANVGRIFQALSRYESADYNGYAELIEEFKALKSSDFDPYIAIPVSTVVTCGWQDLDAAPDQVKLLGTRIDELPSVAGDFKYVVTVSCDEAYFRKYAEFMVTSFSRTCSAEASLVISVITDDPAPLVAMLHNWGSKNVVLNPLNILAGENVGPIASLIRFSTVYPLLRLKNIPIVVLDLDSVLTQALGPLVAKHKGADVCSRVLGGGVAPWEKFTGGFAIFYPTHAAIRVAGYMASAASELAGNVQKQWWIDQNCFEAGIRMVRQGGGNLEIDNVMAERDAYCVMPVGTGEAKTHALKSALEQLLSQPLA